MSFKLFDCSPPLYCWAENSNICVKEIDGSVSRYSCALGFVTEPQLIPFVAPDVIWVLRHEGVLFVGRNDGTFSGYRETDDLLVRFGIWAYPRDRRLYRIGQMNGYYAFLDSRDMRSIYITPKDDVYILHKPFSGSVDVYAYTWEGMKGTEDLTIPSGGGFLDVEKVGVWVSPPNPPERSDPVRL